MTKIYRVYQIDGSGPLFLVVSPRGGFSHLLGSVIVAGHVASSEDASVKLALLSSEVQIFLFALTNSSALKSEKITSAPASETTAPGRGSIHKVDITGFPGIFYGVDAEGICRTNIHVRKLNAKRELDSWYYGQEKSRLQESGFKR